MNRQQLRNSINKGQVITIVEHEYLVRTHGVMLLKKLVNDYSAAVCLTLRDELRFGKKRSTRFLKRVNELFDDIADDRLKIEDVKKTIQKELGVIIQ